MNRKLASIQTIESLTSIEGADSIEKARILGWDVVVKKGDFKQGDLCCYCEIDSILPERSEFEFLRNKKFRIRTIKLRGQISQGIAFPLSILKGKKYKIGADVTKELGILKHESDDERRDRIDAERRGTWFTRFWKKLKWTIGIGKRRKVTKGWPSFIPHTDETRLQAVPEVLKEIENKEVYITTKIDGTSGTFFLRGKEYGVCSRHVRQNPDIVAGNVYVQASKKYKIEEGLRRLGKNLAIQGEIAGISEEGEGIKGKVLQGNKLGLKELKLFVFNVWDIDKACYLGFFDMKRIIDELGLEMVPFLSRACISNQSIEDWVQRASDVYYRFNEVTPAEGIVVRPVEETYSKVLKGRLSFKVINPKFLLKYEN